MSSKSPSLSFTAPERRNHECILHLCIPSAYHSTWHTDGIQEIFVEETNELRNIVST